MADIKKTALASLFVSKLKQAGDEKRKTRQLEFMKRKITLDLQGRQMEFQNGEWHLRGVKLDEETQSQLKELRKENVALTEKSNMLEFKLELLVDMLTVKELDLLNARKELEEIYAKYTQYKKISKPG